MATYLRLRRSGFDEASAGNLTGVHMGLNLDPDQKRAWTVRELMALDFVRWRAEHDPELAADRHTAY